MRHVTPPSSVFRSVPCAERKLEVAPAYTVLGCRGSIATAPNDLAGTPLETGFHETPASMLSKSPFQDVAAYRMRPSTARPMTAEFPIEPPRRHVRPASGLLNTSPEPPA